MLICVVEKEEFVEKGEDQVIFLFCSACSASPTLASEHSPRPLWGLSVMWTRRAALPTRATMGLLATLERTALSIVTARTAMKELHVKTLRTAARSTHVTTEPRATMRKTMVSFATAQTATRAIRAKPPPMNAIRQTPA